MPNIIECKCGDTWWEDRMNCKTCKAQPSSSNVVDSHQWGRKSEGCQICTHCGAARHDKEHEGYYFWFAGVGYDNPTTCNRGMTRDG